MNSICEHCEYGNRFIDLGQCPECQAGRIVGDLHTRDIFCSHLHQITTFAVDFCGKQNCYDMHIFTDYQVFIASALSYQQLVDIGKYTEKTPVQLYHSIKNGSPCCEKSSFFQILKICKYLYENEIKFKTEPDFPILYNFSECFPALAQDYEWVFEMLRKNEKAD